MHVDPPSPEVNTDLGESLKKLNTNRAGIYNERQALARQLEIVDEYAKTLDARDADVSKLGTFLDFYVDRKRTVNEAIATVDEKLAAIDKEIREAHVAQRSDTESRKRAVKVTIVVLADEDGPAELALSYNVTGASWTPLYDVRAHIAGDASPADKTDSHSVLLHYRASIAQQTGEHWNNVALTLSTASPQLGSDIPTLNQHTIGELVPPVVHPFVAKGGGLFGARQSRVATESATVASYAPPPGASLFGGFGAPASAAAPPPPVIRIQAAAVTEAAVSATFTIEGQSSIPSDSDESSQTHKVSIVELTLSKVELEWIAVPKERESVFLQARRIGFLLYERTADLPLTVQGQEYVRLSPSPWPSEHLHGQLLRR